ncbi:MAG TPA: hypothetical protein VIY53_15525 [Acidobacteriaceae bacterium]
MCARWKRGASSPRGITNALSLRGQLTPTQDVLHSREALGHGEALEAMVFDSGKQPPQTLTWIAEKDGAPAGEVQ